MAASEATSADAPGIGATGRSEVDRLRATCRRQATVIETLREVVSRFGSGAQALKAENTELRGEVARLRGSGRAFAGDRERHEGEGLAEVRIPAGLQAAAQARDVISRCLDGHVAQCVLDNALLVISELVTNSVRHSGVRAGEPVVVRAHLWRDSCRLEVEDPGYEGVIAPRPAAGPDGSGMGLQVVQTLSERWGVVRAGGGPTRVWAQLTCGIGAA